MPAFYTLNDISFKTKQQIFDFVNNNSFLDLVAQSIQKPLRNIYYPSDGDTILRIDITTEDGLHVTSELKQFAFTNKPIKYNWHRTFEAIRHSGANYSEESNSQKKAFKQLDEIQSCIEVRLRMYNIQIE